MTVDPRSVFVEYQVRPGRRKLVLIVVAVAVVLVGAVYLFRATVSSPESAVRGYFDALADRDAQAALAATAPEVRDQAARDLISDAVLASDGYLPPANVDVTEVSVDGRGAVAEVSYRVGDREQTAVLRLRRDQGLRDTLFHRWLVVDGIGTLRLGEAPAEVVVNGHRIAAYDTQGPRILPALPGGYQIGVPEDDPLWEPREVPAEVVPQGSTDVSVPLAARPAVRDSVEQQVRDLLDDCAASTALVPPGCPFGYAVVAQAENVAWRIEEYPRLALTASPGGGSVLVTSSADGEAVITGSRRFVGEFTQPIPFPVSGTATVQSDSVFFQPDW